MTLTAIQNAPEPAAEGRALSPRQRERRDRILEVTYALLARHGYDGVSMKMIAAQAGVAERTLFNIYSTKDALIAMSARERTALILSEAVANAADPGIGFFVSLCETLARRTLEAPEVARALAPVLVQQAELVGLNALYRRHVGQVLEGLAASGLVEDDSIEVLNALIGMDMVGNVTLWAGHVIADAELETHMRLSVCQVLLTHSRGTLREWAWNEARACVARLSGRPGRTTPS